MLVGGGGEAFVLVVREKGHGEKGAKNGLGNMRYEFVCTAELPSCSHLQIFR